MQWKTKYLHLYLLDLFVFFWLVFFHQVKRTHTGWFSMCQTEAPVRSY